MNKMICFDMDGTIADLYSVPNWLEKLRAEDPSPYAEAKPLVDMGMLSIVLRMLSREGWEIRVISWLSKDSSESYKIAVRKAKLEWLARYNFPYKTAHLVQYGTTKADCVRRYTDAAILIDDDTRVRSGWHLGQTIDPTQVNIIDALTELLELE